MLTNQFDYNLPDELIAKYPPKERGTTRLLVVDKKSGQITHKKYADLPDYFNKGDIAVLNQTKVIKARFYLNHPNQSKKVEVLLIKPIGSGELQRTYWEALIGGAKNLNKGDQLFTEDKKEYFEFVSREGKLATLSIPNNPELFTRYGHTPLPPYMKREDQPDDYIRYNTVFAQNEGSVAAPTASLNLTPEIISKIKAKEAQVAYVDLQVGWGTFAPVNTEKIEEFKIHKESFTLSVETATAVNQAKNSKNKVFAFGTTATRTLESSSSLIDGIYNVIPQTSETEIFIYPGYEWKIVDNPITNFHAPKSSLIMLVASILGLALTKEVYNVAIKEEYNFLSYGDSMLIV